MVNPETLLITPEYVRDALDQIIQAKPSHTANPLQFLHLVDSHMVTSDFTFFHETRRYALNDLLVSTIQAQYLHQRTVHGFALFEMGSLLSRATEIIAEDAATGNSDLIGWSWLYFHYTEMNLRISQQQFCHLVNLDDRTIRRYQNSTIDQLAKCLIRMEQGARKARRRQILYLHLPHKGTTFDLVDREKELQLVRKSKLKHYFIVGVAGIGKTVFVEKIIKERIDNDEFDHLVWVHSPESIENVRLYLRERLLSEDSKITLVEYVSLKKTTIVIDNTEKLQEDGLGLQGFLQDFSHATIFLISRLFQPIPNCLQIHLHELSLVSVQSMLRLGKVNYEISFETIDYARLIWQSVGGNPLAIELLAQNWSVFEFQSATLITLDQLFAQLFDSMTTSERLAWLILALLTDQSLASVNLSEISSSRVAYTDFITLGRLCIAKLSIGENSNLTITVSAGRYIQIRYKSSLDLQHYLDQFVSEINLIDINDSEINLALIEALLSADWVLMSTYNYIETVRQFWKIGLHRGHYTKWYVILSKLIHELAPQNLDLAVGYGISQRCLGRWSQSHSVFSAVVEYAGMQGMFTYQVEALLELAILLHNQGDYTGTFEALNHIAKFPEATTSTLQYRVLVERIEVLLERNNIVGAKSLFVNLPINEPRRFILQLEIQAKDGNTGNNAPFLASLSDKLLLDFSNSPSLAARIHILVGRIYQRTSEVKTAIKHLTIAQSILTDIDNDPFALARTQSNLAMLLITVNQLVDAQELLKSAENIQRKIGDRVGLAVTMHNEHVVDRKIVN